MREDITERVSESRPSWESLEGMARLKIQGWLQDLLEEEVTEFLGRSKSERRGTVDASAGYRNGLGKSRKLTFSGGTIEVRRPRMRGLEERFESQILPLFVRRTRQVDEVLPELYLHGLAHGDFDLALRGLLGEKAPISGSTVARLKEKWHAERELWGNRRLDDLEVVYLWVDGVYVKAGLEKEKAALLVAIAGKSDGSKTIVAVTPGHRESTESWSAVLRDLKDRGMGSPRLVIGDGHLGIWGALRNVYPEAQWQRCWNHRIMNILDKIPRKRQEEAKLLIKKIPYAETLQEAESLKGQFQRWCRQKGLLEAARALDRDWDHMVTFYQFPKEHWQHLRTSNPIESPFAALRLRTNAAKRFKKVENATAVIWKMLLVAEKTFRRLNEPDLAKEVYLGVTFVNGERLKKQDHEAVA
ncbi:MAG: IS256 family transposase [Candidatus Binatia bacterium]